LIFSFLHLVLQVLKLSGGLIDLLLLLVLQELGVIFSPLDALLYRNLDGKFVGFLFLDVRFGGQME
jgi:hypothetical protein